MGLRFGFRPDVTDELRRSLQVGQSVEAEGYGTENAYGRGLEALRLGFHHGKLTPLDTTVRSLNDPAQPAQPGPKYWLSGSI